MLFLYTQVVSNGGSAGVPLSRPVTPLLQSVHYSPRSYSAQSFGKSHFLLFYLCYFFSLPLLVARVLEKSFDTSVSGEAASLVSNRPHTTPRS